MLVYRPATRRLQSGLDAVKKEFPLPVIGVLEPGARAALAVYEDGGRSGRHRHRGHDREQTPTKRRSGGLRPASKS